MHFGQLATCHYRLATCHLLLVTCFPVFVSAQLTQLWDCTLGGSGYEELNASSTQGSNGKTSAYYGGPGDYWLLELDGSGQKIREWSFGGSGFDDLYYVLEIGGGNLLSTL